MSGRLRPSECVSEDEAVSGEWDGWVDTLGEARAGLPVRGLAVAELSTGLDQRLRFGAHRERADGKMG